MHGCAGRHFGTTVVNTSSAARGQCATRRALATARRGVRAAAADARGVVQRLGRAGRRRPARSGRRRGWCALVALVGRRTGEPQDWLAFRPKRVYVSRVLVHVRVPVEVALGGGPRRRRRRRGAAAALGALRGGAAQLRGPGAGAGHAAGHAGAPARPLPLLPGAAGARRGARARACSLHGGPGCHGGHACCCGGCSAATHCIRFGCW